VSACPCCSAPPSVCAASWRVNAASIILRLVGWASINSRASAGDPSLLWTHFYLGLV
jgi:hypothetical protein